MTSPPPGDPGEDRRGSGRPRWLLFAAGLVPLALVGALAVGMATGVGQDPSGDADTPFRLAPDFTLPSFGGESFTLSEHAGGPVFLYFWASWCVPCQEEAPVIQALWPEYERRGYTFVGVNILDSDPDAQAFIDRFGLTFPNVRDEQGDVYLEYGVYGVPESFFLAPGLEVRSKFLGALTEASLPPRLDALEHPDTN